MEMDTNWLGWPSTMENTLGNASLFMFIAAGVLPGITTIMLRLGSVGRKRVWAEYFGNDPVFLSSYVQ
jgi:hypothetical protein